MKRIFILLPLILLLSVLAIAEMPQPEAIPLDSSLASAIQPLLQKVSLLVGGIFSLYFIIALVQIYHERKKMRLLQDIRNDVDKLTVHFGIKHAHPRQNILKRIFGFLWSEEEENKKSKK